MNRFLCLWILLCLAPVSAWEDGDLIFHQSKSSQSRVIRQVTSSRYTHLGIIVHLNSKPFVLEAIQPVSLTPLDRFIARGEKQHYVVKRLRKRLNTSQIRKMKQLGESWLGRSYDLHFGWDDRELYCSELVWKLFSRTAGLEVGRPQKFKELDLSAQATKALIRERGRRIDPEETIVTPAAMFDSKLLKTVHSSPAP